MIIITLQFTDATALILAAVYGNTDTIKLLLKHPNININAQDNKGKYSFISHSFFYTYDSSKNTRLKVVRTSKASCSLM